MLSAGLQKHNCILFLIPILFQAVDAFLQQLYFENSCWCEGFSLASETERKFKTGNPCRNEIFLTWKKFFSVELLLLLPSQGDWHASSGCQYTGLPWTKEKKSQQCVCYLNICNTATISKVEEITGILYTLGSSIYGLGSLLLCALLDLSSEIILLSDSGQKLLYPKRNWSDWSGLVGEKVVSSFLGGRFSSWVSYPEKYALLASINHIDAYSESLGICKTTVLKW